MIKNRTIIILIVFALLLAGVIIEQIFINTTLDSVINKTLGLQEQIENTSDINTNDIIENIENLDEYWTEKENSLCIIINHRDMEKVGEQIIKLKTYIIQNDKKNAVYEADILYFYINGFKHIMSVNFQNIF